MTLGSVIRGVSDVANQKDIVKDTYRSFVPKFKKSKLCTPTTIRFASTYHFATEKKLIGEEYAASEAFDDIDLSREVRSVLRSVQKCLTTTIKLQYDGSLHVELDVVNLESDDARVSEARR